MPIRFACVCGRELAAEAGDPGESVACPGCGAEVEVPSAGADGPRWLDALAGWAFAGPLTALLIGLCLVQWLVWLPQYLTWNWHQDYDDVATMALAWDAGKRPYRDMLSFQFPGEIYLLWALGKIFGWGKTWPLYAFDAALVGLFGVVMVAWSRVRFGRALPGAIGFATFLSWYLNQEVGVVAQRDGHACLAAIMGLLVLEARPDRAGRLISAVAMGIALVFRPQVIVLAPALILAVGCSRRPGASRAATARTVLAWGATVGLVGCAGFLPLARAGLLGDFFGGLRIAAFSTGYAVPGLAYRLGHALKLLRYPEFFAVGFLALALGASARPVLRRSSLTWTLALVGAMGYKLISPRVFPYHDIIIFLVWSVAVAVLAELILEAPRVAGGFRLAALLLLCSQGISAYPANFAPGNVREAVRLLRGGTPGARSSLARLHGMGEAYTWQEYHAALDYLRGLPPGVEVINGMRMPLPINGPSARLPGIPYHSLNLVYFIPRYDDVFCAALAAAPASSVVVWDPRNPPEVNPWTGEKLGRFRSLIPTYYEPSKSFGLIEVWRRRGTRASGGMGGGPSRAGWPRGDGPRQVIDSSVTTKIKVELAGMGPFAVAPYPSAGGIEMIRVSPTFMPAVPASKPGTTCPAPSLNPSGDPPSLAESSKILPFFAR